MGHSYITYRGKEQHVRDGDIALVVYTIIAYAASGLERKLPDQIQHLLQLWEHVIDDCGPGCIDLKLDAYLGSQADRQHFLGLASRAKRQLLDYPGEPGMIAFTKAITGIQLQSIYFGDYLKIEQIDTAFAKVLAVLKH